MAKIVESKDFEMEVREGVSVVDFYADWCGPCKMIAPIFEELSQELSANFIKINVDNSQDIAAKFQVASIPTLIILKNGTEVDRIVGFMPKPALESKIKQYL